jgi:hypothetical protein
MSLSYGNHEDMAIVFHRSNFIYKILKVVSDKTPPKNLLKLIGNHNMIKRYIILCLIAIKIITGTKNIMY